MLQHAATRCVAACCSSIDDAPMTSANIYSCSHSTLTITLALELIYMPWANVSSRSHHYAQETTGSTLTLARTLALTIMYTPWANVPDHHMLKTLLAAHACSRNPLSENASKCHNTTMALQEPTGSSALACWRLWPLISLEYAWSMWNRTS